MANRTFVHLLQVVRNGDLEIGMAWGASVLWQPRADIYQTDDEVLIQVEVPGCDEENLRLRFESGQLIIEGVRECPSTDTPGTSRRCFQVEIERGPFRSVLPLPTEVAAEEIEARYQSGMLFIRVPRKKPTLPGALRIEVE